MRASKLNMSLLLQPVAHLNKITVMSRVCMLVSFLLEHNFTMYFHMCALSTASVNLGPLALKALAYESAIFLP